MNSSPSRTVLGTVAATAWVTAMGCGIAWGQSLPGLALLLGAGGTSALALLVFLVGLPREGASSARSGSVGAAQASSLADKRALDTNLHRDVVAFKAEQATLNTDDSVDQCIGQFGANPAASVAEGNSLGTTGQWRDLSEQRHSETRLNQVVQAARDGGDPHRTSGDAINALLDSIQATMAEVQASAMRLSSASQEITQTSNSLSNAASQQASHIDDTTPSLLAERSPMGSRVTHLVSAAQQTASSSEQLSATAEELASQIGTLRDTLERYNLANAPTRIPAGTIRHDTRPQTHRPRPTASQRTPVAA
ncbi:MAG: hypothetical protein ACOVOG_08130 [Rubrivivax sp.]|nr:methyl-accepting chemotaxis protein [Rubrivivax sp.]